MKLLLLIIIATGSLFVACESEYHHQLRQAKELVRQEVNLRNSIFLHSDFSAATMHTFRSLQADIRFRAHLSGNEDLFFEELKAFETELEVHQQRENELLITKYP